MNQKVILVTGSSRGIGAAIAKTAHEQNMQVVLHGHTESSALKKLSEQIGSPYFVFDIADEKQVNDSVKKIHAQLGRIDVLVNCAGIVIPASTLESTQENWTKHYQTNVIGSVNLVKSIAPLMQEQKSGKIINISSIHGHSELSSEGVAAYSASKAALLNLTVSWAREFAPYINVNAISPGFTLTDMSKTWPEHVWKQAKSNLLRRIATPDDVAKATLFFASEQSSFITGQALVVDGGYGITNR